MREADDKSLMLAFQREGSSAAFEELFRRHKDGLFCFLRGLSGNAAIAEDLSQQVWVKLIETAEAGRYQADDSAAFRTYLFTLARNRFIDQEQRSHAATRTQLVEHTQLEHLADKELLPPDLLTDNEQTRDLLAAAIETLPVEQREVLLWWMHGVELAEVSRLIGTPWATLVSRRKYALNKVKLSLARKGIRDAADVIS